MNRNVLESKIEPKSKIYSKYLRKYQKDDLLFLLMIIIVSIASLFICVRSYLYNLYLRENNPNYFYPTFLGICTNTMILTCIILAIKVTSEKWIYSFSENILLEKYFTDEFKNQKTKVKKKLSIYIIKFLHYLIITIHSFLVYDKMDFFPKMLGGHGEMRRLYEGGMRSLTFFIRPDFFDFHYILNLSYTFADLICVMFIYDKQTDVFVMLFHHICTICLILFSYYNHFDSLGSIILFLHNVSDILVYLSRTLLYVKKVPRIFKIIIPGFLLMSFIYCRIYVYGKIIYDYFTNVNWSSYGLIESFKFLLVGLYILHCTWTYKLLFIVYNAILKGKYADSRKFVNT